MRRLLCVAIYRYTCIHGTSHTTFPLQTKHTYYMHLTTIDIRHDSVTSRPSAMPTPSLLYCPSHRIYAIVSYSCYSHIQSYIKTHCTRHRACNLVLAAVTIAILHLSESDFFMEASSASRELLDTMLDESQLFLQVILRTLSCRVSGRVRFESIRMNALTRVLSSPAIPFDDCEVDL